MVRKITKDSFKPLVLKGLSHATNNCYYIPITKVDEIFALIQDYQSKYTLSITINEQVQTVFAFLNIEYYLFFVTLYSTAKSMLHWKIITNTLHKNLRLWEIFDACIYWILINWFWFVDANIGKQSYLHVAQNICMIDRVCSLSLNVL